MSLPEALERAADALPTAADSIRDANGDPFALLDQIGSAEGARLASWMLEHEPEDTAELLDAFAEHEGGAAAVAAIDEKKLPKAGRKLLRRTLHSLRSRGLDVPRAKAPKERVVRLPHLEEAVSGAFALPLDPRGGRAVLLIDPQPGNHSRVYEVVVDDVRGIVDFASYEARRSRVRAFVKQLARRTQGAALPIEASEARALIARAAANQSAERAAPKAFIDHRSRLRLDEAGSTTPGDRAQTKLGEQEPTRERLDRVCEMARIGKIGPWPPALELLRELAEGFKESIDGEESDSTATQRDRVDRAIAECAAKIYDDSFSAVTAFRFRESAFVLWQGSPEDPQLEDARACLAAARAFESLPVAENPLALTLTELLLGPAASALPQETPPEGGPDDSQDSSDGDAAGANAPPSVED